MIDSKKLQYYTMSHRLRGYAEGIDGYGTLAAAMIRSRGEK